MSEHYAETSKKVWAGQEVFRCNLAIRDDYGISEAHFAVYKIGDDHWLESVYADSSSAFGRFIGNPDLERAKEMAPSPNEVIYAESGFVPCPGNSTIDSETAEELFGAGIDHATYEHNSF